MHKNAIRQKKKQNEKKTNNLNSKMKMRQPNRQNDKLAGNETRGLCAKFALEVAQKIRKNY